MPFPCRNFWRSGCSHRCWDDSRRLGSPTRSWRSCHNTICFGAICGFSNRSPHCRLYYWHEKGLAIAHVGSDPIRRARIVDGSRRRWNIEKDLLRRRAITRGHTLPPKPPLQFFLKTLFITTLFRPLRMLIFEPSVSSLSSYVSLVFGVMFAFFDAYPSFSQAVYSFNLGQVGLTFVSVVIGFLFAALTSITINKTLFEKARKEAWPGKMPPPEKRLYVSMVGSVRIPVPLFWYVTTSLGFIDLNPLMSTKGSPGPRKLLFIGLFPFLAGIPFGWGNVCLYVSAILLFLTYKTPTKR